jgi:hypothetical protein
MVRLEQFLGVLGHDVVHHFCHPFRGGGGGFDNHQLSIDAENDLAAHLQMNVGSPAFNGGGQNAKKYFHPASLSVSSGNNPVRNTRAGGLGKAAKHA